MTYAPLTKRPRRDAGRRRRLTAALVLAILLTGGAAGCTPTDGTAAAAGPAATGIPSLEADGQTRVFFLTPNGLWPVWRQLEPGLRSPQGALDALLAGPTADEGARGVSSAIARDAFEIDATASMRRVDVVLPGRFVHFQIEAVKQIVCTAAAAPGIPGGGDPTEIQVALHEQESADGAYILRCDSSGDVRIAG